VRLADSLGRKAAMRVECSPKAMCENEHRSNDTARPGSEATTKGAATMLLMIPPPLPVLALFVGLPARVLHVTQGTRLLPATIRRVFIPIPVTSAVRVRVVNVTVVSAGTEGASCENRGDDNDEAPGCRR
jgi:hypothetical protein